MDLDVQTILEGALDLPCFASSYSVQHLVREERHPQADMAASKVQAVELHRLCNDETAG